ncbi:MAG: elongation factor Ts [Sulfurospirillum sp.]|nr:elongation factor Ts [Sulfurospirillum sp.]MBL0702851.1 elongation factor Ts [Sulfurospirillum sp.]
MMEITAQLVKKLRETTGAGMMDCKKTLVETKGNIKKAIELLKEKGLGKAEKKAGRVAAEGLAGLKLGENKGIIIEINSETDFVAKNDAFQELVAKTVDFVYDNEPKDIEVVKSSDFIEYFNDSVSKIGEKIELRRFKIIKTTENEAINGYIHSNNRIAVIIKAKCDSLKTAENIKPFLKNIAMHASAMKPSTLSYKDFSTEYVKSETKGRIEIIKKENEELSRLKKPLKNVPDFVSRLQLTDEIIADTKKQIKKELLLEGKPEKILDKIIPGKIARYILDNTTLDQEQCLLDQQYVMNDKLTVGEAVKAEGEKIKGTAEIIEFTRIEVGEGIQKKVEDFAAEVTGQLG